MATLPEHLSSPSIFSGVRVTRSSAFCVCFVDRLSFCHFSFGLQLTYSDLPICYLEALLKSTPVNYNNYNKNKFLMMINCYKQSQKFASSVVDREFESNQRL
jgi:hypothetical protein